MALPVHNGNVVEGLLRLRPDMRRYRRCFDLPAVKEGIGVTFMGVSTLLIDDGTTQLLTDGFFSRPSFLRVALGKLSPNQRRIESSLDLLGLKCKSHDPVGSRARLDAVVPLHAHYDHALDSAAVAECTGAFLYGGESTVNLAYGYGLPSAQVHLVAANRPESIGAFSLTFIPARHGPPERYPGKITSPLRPASRARRFRSGEPWSLLVKHATGVSMMIHASAGYRVGALADVTADVVYLGVGQLGWRISPIRKVREEYIRAYWTETVTAVRASRAVLIHWDDLFRPLDTSLAREMRAMPYVADNLRTTMGILERLAYEQNVCLSLPEPGVRAHPWIACDR
jgi:L-ascorbate metabolism protein UlaG (beta-lactamase superfamily)